MSNIKLNDDEVVLYEGTVGFKGKPGNQLLTLTSQKMVFEKETGVFKKEREIVNEIELHTVKFYHDAAQIKQRGAEVDMQTTVGNFTLVFAGMFEARKFTNKVLEAVTDMTLLKRGATNVKNTIETVDDTLGVDTRGTVKGFFEQGLKGLIWNGTGKRR